MRLSVITLTAPFIPVASTARKAHIGICADLAGRDCRTYVNAAASRACEAPGITTPVEDSTSGGVEAMFAAD